MIACTAFVGPFQLIFVDTERDFLLVPIATFIPRSKHERHGIRHLRSEKRLQHEDQMRKLGRRQVGQGMLEAWTAFLLGVELF